MRKRRKENPLQYPTDRSGPHYAGAQFPHDLVSRHELIRIWPFHSNSPAQILIEQDETRFRRMN